MHDTMLTYSQWERRFKRALKKTIRKKLADLNEHMEKLRNQREILRMQTDIINLVLKVNDYEYLKTLQNHVRVACNQQNKKQEA